MTFQVQIIDNGTVIYSLDVNRSLELGRQQQGEPQPISLVESDSMTRLIVATLDDVRIGRRQLLVETQSDGALRLTNLSNKVSLQIRGLATLEESATRVLAMPVSVRLSPTRLATFSEKSTEPELESLASATLAPGRGSEFAEVFRAQSTGKPSDDAEQLVRALQATMDVFQSARTVEALFDCALAGAVQLVGFDGARILKYESGTWREQQRFREGSSAASQPARSRTSPST